jgi:hypothetical protein
MLNCDILQQEQLLQQRPDTLTTQATTVDVPQSFRRLLWCIPLSILIHNLEEYPKIVTYAHQHGIAIKRRQMGIAVALATLLPIPITAIATRSPSTPLRLQIVLAIPALMAINAATHLAQTIILKDYSPGTLTGVSINLPLAAYLYQRALCEGILTPREARQAIIAGATLMAPTALLLQLLGWIIDRALPREAAT